MNKSQASRNPAALNEDLPESRCPRCGCEGNEPVNTSYVYQPQEIEGTEFFWRKLVSVTYTWQCAKCEHRFAESIEPEE